MKKYAVLWSNTPINKTSRGFAANFITSTHGPFNISVTQLTDRNVTKMAADPNVAYVTPLMPTKLIEPLISNSSNCEDNWGVCAVMADKSQYTGAGVNIAILDTGIDSTHPAFTNIDIFTKDFCGNGAGDNNGHGTHCAGIVFGRDVGRRIGVARGVSRALIGKVLSDEGNGDTGAIFEALYWAMQEGADIVSLSLGLDFPGMVSEMNKDGWPLDLATSKALEAYRFNLRMFDAIMRVFRVGKDFGKSPLVVAAAGNESKREVNPEYRIAASLPAAAENVLSVAAIEQRADGYGISSFSNSFASISGPGVKITSAWPGGGFHTISGTSMACPHVAGVAALWWEYFQKTGSPPSSEKVATRLVSSARNDVFLGNCDEEDVGCGLVTAP